MAQNEQSEDASFTPGGGKAGTLRLLPWGGKGGTLHLLLGGKAGTLRLLQSRALGQQLIEFRKAGGRTDFIETLINFVSGKLSFS